MPRITDYEKLATHIQTFYSCVKANSAQLESETSTISFVEEDSWLYKMEYYKRDVYKKTRECIDRIAWNEKEIGQGRIAKTVKEAFNCTGNDNNLVSKYSKMHFNNKCNDQVNYLSIDRAFYDLYHGNDDKKALDELTAIFGKKYDLIAFLFFIKDPKRYLPNKPKFFDAGFKLLGINYKTEGLCSWENYNGYIEVIEEIQEALNNSLSISPPAHLIDAHSFVWIVCKNYDGWRPNSKTEDEIRRSTPATIERLRENALLHGSASPERREVKSVRYYRDGSVAKYVKKLAGGICQLCENLAPFPDKNGYPYLEAHHVVWLSRYGKDTVDNVVALCPNCHARMHMLDDPDDVQKLKQKAEQASQDSPF